MKRDPSIHITLSKFRDILSQLEIKGFPTEEFFTKARKYSVDTRVISVNNNKVKKQIDTIALASHGDVQLVAEIIYATRIKLKQRGVRQINQSNVREWSTCKKLADICNQFCEDFQLETRAGFIKYIELGIGKCNGNNRNLPQRLISMSDSITDSYGCELEIEEYLGNSRRGEYRKEEVKDIHDTYVNYIANSTGIVETYLDNPEKYIHFCRINQLVKEHHWDPTEFIMAQFEALSFCNGIPSPDNMYGDKAIERFNKYIYRKRSNPDTPVVAGSLWDKIK